MTRWNMWTAITNTYLDIGVHCNVESLSRSSHQLSNDYHHLLVRGRHIHDALIESRHHKSQNRLAIDPKTPNYHLQIRHDTHDTKMMESFSTSVIVKPLQYSKYLVDMLRLNIAHPCSRLFLHCYFSNQYN